MNGEPRTQTLLRHLYSQALSTLTEICTATSIPPHTDHSTTLHGHPTQNNYSRSYASTKTPRSLQQQETIFPFAFTKNSIFRQTHAQITATTDSEPINNIQNRKTRRSRRRLLPRSSYITTTIRGTQSEKEHRKLYKLHQGSQNTSQHPNTPPKGKKKAYFSREPAPRKPQIVHPSPVYLYPISHLKHSNQPHHPSIHPSI